MTEAKDTLQKISGESGKNLAFVARKGMGDRPTIVFLGGYASDMTGSKASFLDRYCREKGYSFLRFDYSGHGQSEGEFAEGSIGAWTEDALTVINHAVKGDMILIGSSMGGWIGLKVAMALGARVKGFIGIAVAPDFTDWVWNELTDRQKEECKKQGGINLADKGYMTYKLLEDGRRQRIMDKPITLPCPVTLLQGKKDESVPYQVAGKLAAHITSPQAVEVIMIDGGDHRLTRPQDLEILITKIEENLAV